MYIIIVGNGKVGYTLAQHLSRENNDVVIVDTDADSLKKASDVLDVMCLRGNGLSANIQLEAGVANADLMIAVTPRDEVNMLCCLTARKLGAKHTIARIRDPEYTDEIDMLKSELEIDMVINPEQEAAAEIARLIRFPAATNIDTFARGKVELVGFRVTDKDTIAGMKISKITPKLSVPILFCAVERGDDGYIPKGDFVIEVDDILFILGEPRNIMLFFKAIGRSIEKTKHAMIIGGGRITHYLADIIGKMGIHIKIIEMDEERCIELNELLPHCLIINGDGSDEDLLASENIGETNAFIALTDRDEENLLMALYAAQLGVPNSIAKINRISYNGIVRNLGVESIVSPKNLMAELIIRFVRGMNNILNSEFETMYKIVDGKAEALQFRVNATTKIVNTKLKNLRMRKNVLVACIIRKGRIIIPSGNDSLQGGDSVIIIAMGETFSSLNDVLDEGDI